MTVNDGHTFGEWQSNGDGTHTRKCTVDGCNGIETKDCSGGTATCTEKAVCENCGKAYGELDPNNHTDLEHNDARAATEDAEGNTEYRHNGCQQKEKAQQLTKYGVSTVKRALNDLCEAGYLQKQARFDERKKGGQTSNLYTLILTADSDDTYNGRIAPETSETMAKLDGSTELRIIRRTARASRNSEAPADRRIDFSGLLSWTGVQSNFIPP